MSKQQYDDIFVRDALTDTGSIPFPGRTAFVSPDIIPSQANVVPASQLISTYDAASTDPSILEQQFNNIYVRAKNLSTNSASGTVSLYWSTTSLILTPQSWVGQQIKDASGETSIDLVDENGNTSIAPSGIAVGSGPFVFNAPQVPSGFHYCLIAQVVTAEHPNAIPSEPFTSTADFATWVVNNPAISWLNISVVPANLPTFQQLSNFANLDPDAEEYMFIVKGSDWPDGTTVNLQSSSIWFSFSYTQTFGSDPTNQLVSTIQTVPGGYSGWVMLTVTPPAGATVPITAMLRLIFAKYVDDASELIFQEVGVPASSLGVQGRLSTATVVRLGETLIVIGSPIQ